MLLELKNTKSVLTWLICLSYIGMFFSIRIGNIALVPLLVFCLISVKPKDILHTLRENAFSKIIVGLFLLQVIGLSYTSNISMGLFMLEKKASFLLIPLLVLPLLQKVAIDNRIIFLRLGYITLLSSLVLLCIAVYKMLVLKAHNAFYFENFTSIHYVYYSLYFAIGSLLLIDSLLETLLKRKYGFLILTLLFVYSLSIQILVGSKTGIIGFCLASIFLLYQQIANKKLFAISILVFFISTALILYSNDTTRSRFVGLTEDASVLTQENLAGDDFVVTGLTLRLLFWKISLAHSWEDHPLLGAGTGDAQDYINSLLTLPKIQLNSFVNFDSHNQWVFTFVQLGLIGILGMAWLFGKYFREAYRSLDLKLISFLIITLGFSLSESILESNKGIIFFTLFFTIFSVPYSSTLPGLPDSQKASQ